MLVMGRAVSCASMPAMVLLLPAEAPGLCHAAMVMACAGLLRAVPHAYFARTLYCIMFLFFPSGLLHMERDQMEPERDGGGMVAGD